MASFDKKQLQAVADNVRDTEKENGTVRLDGWYIMVPDNEGKFYPDGRAKVPMIVVQLSYPGQKGEFIGRTHYTRDVPITQLARWNY